MINSSYGVKRNNTTTALSLVAVFMLVTMLVTQLFGYEDFAITLAGISSITDARPLTVLAGCVVLVELLALPYLLRMYLSKLMRITSALCGFLISGFWLISALTNAHVDNGGLFSSTLSVPGGLLTAAWSFMLFGLICRVIYADSKFRHVSPLR